MRLAISHQDRPFIDLSSKFSTIDNRAAPVPFVLLLKSSTVDWFLRDNGTGCTKRVLGCPMLHAVSRRDEEEGGELDSHEEASPEEIKRREVSWTLTKKPAQKRSRGR